MDREQSKSLLAMTWSLVDQEGGKGCGGMETKRCYGRIKQEEKEERQWIWTSQASRVKIQDDGEQRGWATRTQRKTGLYNVRCERKTAGDGMNGMMNKTSTEYLYLG
jgi:hypothetical protein